MTSRAVLVACVLAAACWAAAAAGATPPQPVAIEVHTTGAGDAGPAGPFTASGSVCPAGETETLSRSTAGFERGFGGQIQVRKRFICDDGSGTFDLLLNVAIRFGDPLTIAFHWVVVDGTGAYAGLHGTGTGTGVPTDAYLLDTYTGALHID